MPGTLDLNVDAGESAGPYRYGDDAGVFPWVSSVSVACGFHAGDPRVMRETVALAARHGLAVGAHVSYPDRAGFGRRHLAATPDEVYEDCLYQIGALAGFLRAAGLALSHVKPHGALYNYAARDEAAAGAIAEAVRDFDPGLALMMLAGSAGAAAAEAAGVRVLHEAFADRAYEPDGSLAARSRPGSLITDPKVVAARAVRMAREGTVVTLDGGEWRLRADTLCLHGDTPGAATLARAAREALDAAGVRVAPAWLSP
ncbi:MAG TPA: 5-oxoprolinase subunit PxpA [Deinococcales bacterium]|nr:5-oxoprolinase subunit PxpA [Deinococcales bacterium]